MAITASRPGSAAPSASASATASAARRAAVARSASCAATSSSGRIGNEGSLTAARSAAASASMSSRYAVRRAWTASLSVTAAAAPPSAPASGAAGSAPTAARSVAVRVATSVQGSGASAVRLRQRSGWVTRWSPRAVEPPSRANRRPRSTTSRRSAASQFFHVRASAPARRSTARRARFGSGLRASAHMTFSAPGAGLSSAHQPSVVRISSARGPVNPSRASAFARRPDDTRPGGPPGAPAPDATLRSPATTARSCQSKSGRRDGHPGTKRGSPPAHAVEHGQHAGPAPGRPARRHAPGVTPCAVRKRRTK